MERHSALKVGIGIALGAALFWYVFGFFSRLDLDTYPLRVVFPNTNGLIAKSPVRMNGVTVGDVASIELNSDFKPLVTLRIQKKVRIPRNARFSFTSGLLIANPQIQIDPTVTPSADTLAENALVNGESASALSSLSPEASQAVQELTGTMRALGPKISKTLDEMNAILKNANAIVADFKSVSGSVKQLASDESIRLALRRTLANLTEMSAIARKTADAVSLDLKDTLKRNSGKLEQLADGAIELLQSFAETVDTARASLAKLSEQVTDPRIQQSLAETLDLARVTMARFGQIAADIHSLLGDADVQGDIKDTLASLKRATEQGQQVVEKVSNLVSKIDLPKGGPKLGIGRPAFAVDLLGRAYSPRFRSDLSVRFPIGETNAFTLGLYDFAEQNKFIAQGETLLGHGSFRYGLYASKLGLGFDWQASPNLKLVLDGFNPNDPQFDARALVHLTNDFSLWVGADRVFKRTTPVLGVRLKR